MPWTLYYNHQAPGERESLEIERHLLEECPDVDSLSVRRQGIPFGDTALDVFFVDDLFRTDNEDLIRIALRRSTYPQVPSEVPRTVQQRLIDEFLANPEARSRFAERLIAPIRERRDYRALAQALMPIQQLPLPPGVALTYENPVTDATLRDFEAYHGSPAPLPSGFGASIMQVEHHLRGGVQSTRSLVRGLSGMLYGHVGHLLHLTGSSHPGNNGIFLITEVGTFDAVEIAGGDMIDLSGSMDWHVEAPREMGDLSSAFVTDLNLPPARSMELLVDFEPLYVANPAGNRRGLGVGALLREVIPPASFDLLREGHRPMPPGGVAEAQAHIHGLLLNDMRGDATVHATLAHYSHVSGYTPDEPGFFPVTPLTRMPLTGFGLVSEISNMVHDEITLEISPKKEAPPVTGWSVILDDGFLDDD